MKLHIHNYTMVIYIQYKVHDIPFNGYLVLAEDGKSLKSIQTKGNNSYIIDTTLVKLHVHDHTMVIYIQCISLMKFHLYVT